MRKFLFVPVGFMSASVFAAVPEGVTSAMTDAKADALTIAGLVLVVIIAIAAFKYMRKAI
jgi:hypothetical protein